MEIHEIATEVKDFTSIEIAREYGKPAFWNTVIQDPHLRITPFSPQETMLRLEQCYSLV